ncbi:hypothetical protein LOD99_8206 [Oopsacas minuta]|uniref:ATP-dependent DNA helicase n=1 Tax=Oopsacas minuta TaxID=111878 RepID=A0AAV7JIW7_9METZ|nr:hypothetical protein LOD99_8206 [Oopsacas minuta]
MASSGIAVLLLDGSRTVHIRLEVALSFNVSNLSHISGLVSPVYGDNIDDYQNQEFMCQRIIMSPQNDTLDAVNDYVMGLIPGDSGAFLFADSFDDIQTFTYPTEY